MEALRGKGYSRHFLRMAAKEKISMGGEITQALNKKVLPIIVKFSGMAKGLAAGIRRNFERLSHDKSLGMQHRIVAPYKRGKNMQDILVHSKLGPANKGAPTKAMIPW